MVLWDEQADAPGKALAYIEGVLPDLSANDLLNGGTPDQVRGRMRVEASLEAALSGADYVQENTPENVEVKRAVLRAWTRPQGPAPFWQAQPPPSCPRPSRKA